VNQRVVAFVIAALVVVGGGLLLLTRSGSVPPAGETEVSAPAETPRTEVPPPAPAPAPEPERPRATTPRPRAAAPRPEPTPPAASAAADLVTLRVDSDVAGAQVFVDRNFVGTTPLTTTDIKPGSHRLNVSAPGYEGIAQELTLEPGSREVTIRLRDVRLNASLDVVHKHGMGSCKGQLVATPQGIRYETTNKDDAFRAALLDMDEFAVDYLEKNLRVRVKGKRFNFTDPEGNADRLFVFHRDVEKARERLKKGDPPASE
jgi:hypothetical protein